MINDDERRKVARELRKLTAPGCIRYAEEFYEELREIVAIDLDGSFEGVAGSLADLIDRKTCSLKPIENAIGRVDFVYCSECKETFKAWEVEDFRYCPSCGAEVES